mmetsp:Transcript_46528/g.132689  ORF Transcript_46528/g.132689 Transcript_46528/m.132689 type:complete len:280 (+) Transcript_46528:103-942(+)
MMRRAPARVARPRGEGNGDGGGRLRGRGCLHLLEKIVDELPDPGIALDASRVCLYILDGARAGCPLGPPVQVKRVEVHGAAKGGGREPRLRIVVLPHPEQLVHVHGRLRVQGGLDRVLEYVPVALPEGELVALAEVLDVLLAGSIDGDILAQALVVLVEKPFDNLPRVRVRDVVVGAALILLEHLLVLVPVLNAVGQEFVGGVALVVEDVLVEAVVSVLPVHVGQVGAKGNAAGHSILDVRDVSRLLQFVVDLGLAHRAQNAQIVDPVVLLGEVMQVLV